MDEADVGLEDLDELLVEDEREDGLARRAYAPTPVSVFAFAAASPCGGGGEGDCGASDAG